MGCLDNRCVQPVCCRGIDTKNRLKVVGSKECFSVSPKAAFSSPSLAEHTGLWNSRLLHSDPSYCLLRLHKSCLYHLKPTQKGPQWLLQQSLHQCAFSNKWWVLLLRLIVLGFFFFKKRKNTAFLVLLWTVSVEGRKGWKENTVSMGWVLTPRW